jgi:hypothetical protein
LENNDHLLETNSVIWQFPQYDLFPCFAMKVPEPHLGQDLFFLVILSPDFSYKFHLPFFFPPFAAGFAGAAIFI